MDHRIDGAVLVHPDDPLEVIVLRGFGRAYLFALLPLPVFLLGVAGLRRSVGG